jgi:thiol-disulfide isomerase/thioredoxin
MKPLVLFFLLLFVRPAAAEEAIPGFDANQAIRESQEMYLKGDFQQCLQRIEEVLAAIQEPCMPCEVLKGQALSQLNRKEDALAHFDSLSQMNPPEQAKEIILWEQSLAAWGLKDAVRAEAYLDRLLAAFPENSYGHFLKSQVLAATDRHAEALPHLERYLALAPEGPYAKEARKILEQVNKGQRPSEADGSKPTVDAQLTLLDGSTFDFRAHRGKVILIDFWASWCGPCSLSLPTLKKMAHSFKDDPFILIGISSDRNKQDMMDKIEKERMSWPQIWDAEGSITHGLFGAKALPTFVVIDHEGHVLWSQTGFSDQISRALQSHTHRAIKKAQKAAKN